MRRLTIFVVVLALIYSAYWVVGARAVRGGAVAQAAALQEAGWAVTFDDLSVQGFPSRFDTSIAALDIASPDAAVGYAAPFLQALALSYQPNRVILAFPPTQTVTLGGAPFEVVSTDLRASVGLAANTSLALDAATAEARQVTVTGDAMGTLTFTDLLTAVRERGGDLPNSYDVYLNAQSLVLPTHLRAQLQGSGLPDTLDIVNLDGTVVLDRPLNRHTLPTWPEDPARVRGLTLRSLTVRWGDLAITGDGAITVDATGTPEGTITLRATDWQRMLDIALDAGLLPPDLQFMAASMGQTLSQGQPDLNLPIRFQNGNLSLGPIPLGPAPKVF